MRAPASIVVVLLALLAAPALAQESRFQSDLRREGEDLKESCSGFNPKALVGCIVTVATEDPFHVAIGSLPPLNGMGFGLAFAEHYTPNEQWRISWNADSVFATSGSWRAGAYMKLIHIPDDGGIIKVVRPGATPAPSTPTVTITEYPVFNVYAQAISLDTLTTNAGQDTYSERQTIVGANTIYPLSRVAALRPFRLSLIGAINGRFLDIHSATIPPPVFTPAAQGPFSQTPSFAQFEEGIRFKPSAFGNHLRLNYLLDFQQFAGSSESLGSFHRWSLDLKHEFPLYRTVSSTGPKDTNGPNECFQSVGSTTCPPVSYSRNREGTVGFRVLTTRSTASDGNVVPFYFQPTLGGSDLNGQRLLAAYDDYRFRGPNLIALQESVEHSIWGPIGAYLLFEQGKVTQGTDGFDTGDFSQSFTVGLTVRAGGFPLINLSFAWGGGGHHVIGSIDSSLLGGSSRPSLY
jgi:hypothetical protein